jgi:hypothetical protein
MKLSKKHIYIFLSLIFIIFIIILIFTFTFSFSFSLKENFIDKGTPETSHTVNLPLTTNYTCQNFCSPTARCAITGQQCLSDIDCPGCNPYSLNKQVTSKNISGNNDAGKLTDGVTPTYSTLTTDIGTQSKLYTSIKDGEKSPIANFGKNQWEESYNAGMSLFTKRYTPTTSNFPNMLHYNKKYTLSSEFMEDGPLASNAYI